MAKLLFLRDLGQTEVGAFGLSAPGDLLLVADVQLVRQRCTPVTVCFDDSSVADFFDSQVDQGRRPEQFARLWIHTHPGHSPQPSATDEATFERCFGSTDWALMFIVACGGQTYARLRFSTGPGGQVELPVEVDFTPRFPACDHAGWTQEYDGHVSVELPQPGQRPIGNLPDFPALGSSDPWFDLHPDPGLLEPYDEQLVKPF